MKLLVSLIALGASLFSNSHDVTSLSQWGPYSKNYCGISHIESLSGGSRVDFTLVPGIYRRNLMVPNALFESGIHPWRVNPGMTEITYRYELEWKDRLYVDATYHVLDSSRVLLEMHCVNSTPLNQNLTLQTAAGLRYADDRGGVMAVGNDAIVYAVDYDDYLLGRHGHDYALVYNGWMRGEKSDPKSIGGTVLETSGESGDVIEYSIPPAAKTYMRCRAADTDVSVLVNGRPLTIASSDDYVLVSLPSAPAAEQCCTARHNLRLETLSKGKLRIDAFLTGENVSITARPALYVPEITRRDGSFVVKYRELEGFYGVAWNYPYSQVREFAGGELDVFMRRSVHDHVHEYFAGDGRGHYTASFLRPVQLGPQSDTTLYSLICYGGRDIVERNLEAFHADEHSFTAPYDAATGRGTRDRCVQDDFLPGAGKYALGAQLMQATILTDVVYPVYTQREYIRHFTPGKNWNSLYTWDLGFISWAMDHLDPVKAFEIVRAYTTEEGSQSAFIHHGTPLPIHFFAFEDFVSRTGDDESLAYMYPRLKRFYDFMTGHNPHSTTMMPSGLIRTWDYFYNSGGWDDYPPQHDLVEHPEGYPHVAPMVSSAYYIRAAKIMRLFASKMGLKTDVRQYDADIKKMSQAILNHAWDEDCGYFGYVTHDARGRASGLYRYGDGSNFNMGLDGVSPLVAGICGDDQRDALLSHLFTPGELWTAVGISTVDQRAPYYRIDGYWNGCVWMPHQLVLWKTMLDMGRPDLAEKIAYTALDVWEKEVEESYQCYEHFIISTRRGGGWHNFAGLSSPIVNWFYSYFKPGTVSCGFNTLICNPEMSEACDSYCADLQFDKDASGQNATIILCLNPNHGYKVTIDGKPAVSSSPRPGLVYVTTTGSSRPQHLQAYAAD